MLVGKDSVSLHTGELALDHVLDYFKGLDKWHNIDISSERSPLVPRRLTVVRPESLQVL